MTLFGQRLSVTWTAYPSLLLLWLVLTAIAAYLINLPFSTALVGGLIATLLHLIGVYWHDFGHVIAARWVGYPMVGIQLFSVIARTLYPADEPALPARIHILRALGGPIASALLTVIAFLLWWQLSDRAFWGHWRDVASLVLAFFTLENLLFFTAQVIVPLGFNDGGTIWKWWRMK